MYTLVLVLFISSGLLSSCTKIDEPKVRYDAFQVVRFNLPVDKNATTKSQQKVIFDQVRAIHEVADKHLLDVWATNVVEGWVDVMIPPQLANVYSNLFSLPAQVKIENVQTMIEQNEREREQSRNNQDFFSDYQPYATILSWITDQAYENEDKAEVISIGSTYNGNNIYALHLKTGQTPKPAFVIQCGIHSREWVAVSTCCWMIDQLLNDDVDLLDSFEFIIIPALNVDGYLYTHTTNRLWRKNRQPNSGSTCIGTDLNRNYEYQWSRPGGSNNPCAETYFGSAPFSGPETAVMRSLLRGLSNDLRLVGFFDIHAYGGLWMSPWGYVCDVLPADYPAMDTAMRASVAALRTVNGRSYAFGPTCTTIYQTSGGSRDYSYGSEGVVHSYGVEAFGSNFTPPPSFIAPIGREIWAGVRQTALLLKK